MNEWIISYKLLKRQETELQEKLKEILTPQLTDLRLLPQVCRDAVEKSHENSSDRWHPTDIAIAVALRLYSPESLLSKRRVKRGVTEALSRVLHLNYSYVSKLTSDIRTRYQVIAPFRHEVERLVISN